MREKTVVCVMGLPLAGKSTLGEALSEALGIHYVDIDVGPKACAPPQEKDPYRDPEAMARERKRMQTAYTVLHAAVAANLEAGRSLIISATYSRKTAQAFLQKAVKENGGELKVIWCIFNDTPEEIERRVEHRIESAASLGGCRSVDHYLKDKERYAGAQLPHIAINTSQPLEACVAQALEFINQCQ